MSRQDLTAPRRSFLKGVGATGAIGITGLAGCASDGEDGNGGGGGGNGGGNGGDGGDKESITIGLLNPLSGPISPAGVDAKRGAQIAVDDLGDIDGHPIETVEKDTQAVPDTGVKRARQLVQQENVDVIIGIVSSAVAKAVTEYTASQDVPIILTASQTPDVTKEQCQRTTFRTTTNIIHQQRTTAFAIDELVDDELTTVAGINPDYVYGHQSWEIFKERFGEIRSDVEYVSEQFPQFQKGDYQKEIQATLDADPDIVHSVLYAGDMVSFIQQANQFDFFDQIEEFYMDVTPMQVTQPVGDAAPEGAIVIADSYFRYPDLPAAEEFGQAYMDEFSDADRPIPTVYSYETYGAFDALNRAVEESGGIGTDDIIDGLSGLTFESVIPKTTIREGDHQGIHETYLAGRIGPVDDADFPSSVQGAYGIKPDTMLRVPDDEFADDVECSF